jgi:2-iminobutanoate/2-iminopropanoate deaminase
MIEVISTQEAPGPAGHYSQALAWNRLLFVSGQLPVDPETGVSQPGTIEEQTTRTLDNLEAILVAAGSGLDHVLKTTIYVSDIALWDRVNAIYAHRFGEHKPARAVVPVKTLHHGYQIEIEAVAAIHRT